jgi:TctA family transporter
MAEQQFARAVAVSSDSLTQAFARPVAATLLVLAVVLVLWPALATMATKLRRRSGSATL